MVLVNLIFLIAGLALLVKGADYFVTAAASMAKRFGVSGFVIGLTLVAVGTSIPELASSITASLKHAGGLVIGAIVGSNIANIGLIVGIAALLSAVRTHAVMLKRDGYIMFFAAMIFLLAIVDLVITPIEAAILLAFYVAYILFLIEQGPDKSEKYEFDHFMRYFFKLGYVKSLMVRMNGQRRRREKDKRKKAEKPEPLPNSLGKDIAILIAGGAAVAIGSNFLIDGAIFFANLFNVPDTIIGITLIAVGTSLPELMVTISAAKKGYGSIAVGNVIGSNIANILLILGVSGLIFPLAVTEATLYVAAPFMVLMSALLLVFLRTGWRIKRKEGLIFLVLYGVFMAALALELIVV